MKITHVKTTPKWTQANGEVEAQNASISKHIRIGLDWQKELRQYVTVYRGVAHNTTGKSPAKFLFNRKMRAKLPEITPAHMDLDVCGKDGEQKGKYKQHADEQRKADYSDVDVGYQILVRQENVDKMGMLVWTQVNNQLWALKKPPPQKLNTADPQHLLLGLCSRGYHLKDFILT